MLSSKQRQILALVSGPLAAVVLLCLEPFPGLDENGMKALAGAAWFLLWLVFEPVSLAVTSLWAVIIFSLTGISSPTAAFSFFGSPTNMLLFGATMILGAWQESNFMQRYSFSALSMKFIHGRTKRLLFVYAAACTLLSFITPNIPVVILFCTLAASAARTFSIEPGQSNAVRIMCILSGLCANIGGIATPLGGAPNLATIAITGKVLDCSVEFWQWAAFGIPVSLIIFGMVLPVCLRLFPLKDFERDTMPFDPAFLKKRHEELGPVSRFEYVSVIVMGLALIFWVVIPPLLAPLGLKRFAPLTAAPFVAAGFAALLTVIPVGTDKRTGRFVFAMNWQQAQKNILWSVLLIIMASTLLGEVLVKGGIDKWLANGITALLGDSLSPFWAWIALVFLSGFVSQFASNTGSITLFVPITAALASVYGYNAVAACVTVGMSVNLASMFPFSAATIAVAMDSAEGHVRAMDFPLSGIIMLVIGTAAIMAVAWPLESIVF